MPPSTGVTIGDVFLPAYRGGPPDVSGVTWWLKKLDGWDDGWEGNAQVDQKTQADGVWVSPLYAGPRLLHLAGSLEASSWDAATRAWNRLLAQIPFRRLAAISVSTGEGTEPELTALVRQHEKPVTERVNVIDGGLSRVGFSLSLLAPDPRKYATTTQAVDLVLPLATGGIAPPLTPPITVTGSSTVSQATLVNAGTITTYPTLTITGPCPPARITNLTTSESIRVVDAVPAGQALVIDLLNGTAVTGGQARRVLGSWWGLEPGVNEVAFSADSYDADAELSIAYRSAWK